MRAGDTRDTLLTLPYGMAVDGRSGHILIADIQLPGIVEIDGEAGRIVQVLGREGNGPGEFKAPQRLALSPDGRLLAVYDIGRRTIDILTRAGTQLRRIPIGTVPFLKGMAVGNDTTVVLSGGRLGSGQVPVSLTWVKGGSIAATGPVPPRSPDLTEDRDLDGRIYAAGGPILLLGDTLVLADAGTGDL
ncbi:MAG: hypothetical protein AB7I33_02455, partial [Gemmatimonadales bacterium]